MTQPVTAAAPSPIHEFAAYLRRPQLLEPAGLRSGDSLRRWAVLTALLIAGLGLMLPLLGAWQKAFALPAPEAFDQVSPALLPWIVIAIAPPIEELLFRGWHSGRPRALWLLGCTVLTIAVALTATRGLGPLATGFTAIAAIIAAPIGWLVLRKQPCPRWFAGGFAAIFYVTAALFAVIHLTNYPGATLLSLPLVMPQAWAALVLGFVRQRIGLVGSILAHASANALSLLVAVLMGG